MCGIAGAWLKKGRAILAIRPMCEHMRRRGPDASGEWESSDGQVALGHRRLAIIDLDPRSNQPFASADGRHLIVFNGEIYNYRELADDLRAKGVTLRTTSDTEVILELYRRDGEAAFTQLRGMFALSIWEVEARRLVLARDAHGIKPLYLAHTPNGLMFASQVKALLASGLVQQRPHPAGVTGFFMWGSVPEPFTLYRDVVSVRAGHCVVIEDGRLVSDTAFATLSQAWNAPRRDVDLQAFVSASLRSAIQAHLVADVPVALLLSGGVDSGAIAGLASDLGQDIEGITLRFASFEGASQDESPRAQQIADRYGLRHTLRTVAYEEFREDIPMIMESMDQPTIDGVNTWFAAKAVAERGYKVALSGIGGDEIFCGYDSFQSIPAVLSVGRALNLLRPLRGVAREAARAAAAVTGKPKIAKIPSYGNTFDGAYLLRRALLMPDELALLLTPEEIEEGLAELTSQAAQDQDGLGLAARIAARESTAYLRNQLLRDSDWASMAHSVELRTPLVDWTLTRQLAPFAAEFAGGDGKALLGRSPRLPVPASVLSHEKTGFGLPMGEWLAASRQNVVTQPAVMRYSWARQWAWAIAGAFGFGDVAAG